MAELSGLSVDDELHLQFSATPTLQVLGLEPPWAYSPDWLQETRTRLAELVKNPHFDGLKRPPGNDLLKPDAPFLADQLVDLVQLLFPPRAIRIGHTTRLIRLLMPTYWAEVIPLDGSGTHWSSVAIQAGLPNGAIDGLSGGQREELLRVQRRALDVLAEIPFFGERRLVLARLLDRVLGDPALLTAYSEQPRSELVRLWRSEVFDDEAFAAFPEQTGSPLDLLAWAVDRLHPLADRLAATTPETELAFPAELASLIHQLKRSDVPPGLAYTTLGSSGAVAVQRAFEELRGKVDRDRWTKERRAWLGRLVETGQLAEAREYVSLLYLLAGVLQYLPKTSKRPEDFGLAAWFFEDLAEAYSRRQRFLRTKRQTVAVPAPLTESAGSTTETGRTAPAEQLPLDADPLAELAGLPGLAEPKQRLDELVAEARITRLRADAGMPVGRRTRHFAFSGNPGTGKSLIARALGAAYRECGVLASGQVVEAQRTDVLAETVSETGTKVEKLFGEAVGGVLLINDAHLLEVDASNARNREREVLAVLTGLLAERGDELVVILAGRPAGLQQVLADQPALRAQLSATIGFADYTDDELRDVFLRLAAERGFTVDDGAAEQILRTVQKLPRAPGFGNARLVATLLDQVSVRQAVRVSKVTDPGLDQVMTILAGDLPTLASTILAAGGAVPAVDPMLELDRMIGLTKVKERVRELRTEAQADLLRLRAGIASPPRSRHMVFLGNPGTGKTTVARLLAAIYQELGILGTGQLVEVARADLVAEYLGQTGPKVRAAVERAVGGVLFIDEAYALAEGHRGYGSEAIATLVPLLEEYRDDLVVIMAGYPREMRRLFEQNSGLESRFPVTLEFADYSQAELAAIFTKMATDAGYRAEDAVANRVAALLAPQLGYERFGNGREVRTGFERTLAGQAARIMAMADPSEDQLRTLLLADVPRKLGPAKQPGFYL